jgi:hypothetical protein
MVDIVDQICAQGSQDAAISDILLGTLEDSYEDTKVSDGESVSYTLNAKEIYLKIAQNVELLNLYTCINEKIILQGAPS